MKYLKEHPSNMFTAANIVLGLVIAVLGALTNPLVLITGVIASIIAIIAFVLGVHESILANRDAQRKEIETQQWQEINNFRIDLASEMAKPGWMQDWEAFKRQHPMYMQ